MVESRVISVAWILLVSAWQAPLVAFAQAPTRPTFPPIDGSLTYTIKQEESTMQIDTLMLPDNFVLKVAPGVRAVDWGVTHLVIGSNVTVDLSVPPKTIDFSAAWGPQPSAAALTVASAPLATRGADTAGQAEACQPGAPGGTGGKGADGLNGVSLTLRDVQTSQVGSLWVKTSGNSGSPGGTGGKGQTGGGHLKKFSPGIWAGCSAAGGGSGGAGGAGGRGGDTARVQTVDSRFQFPPATCPNTCSVAVSRPDAATGYTGVIIVSGSVGCGGPGGMPGPGGGPGENGAFWGGPGPNGADGPAGVCIGSLDSAPTPAPPPPQHVAVNPRPKEPSPIQQCGIRYHIDACPAADLFSVADPGCQTRCVSGHGVCTDSTCSGNTWTQSRCICSP